MSLGRTVRLYLADGSPTGVRVAEIMNWTGLVLAAPRSKIDEVIKRPEAQKTGVYLLAGADPEQPNKQRLYIGEGDEVVERLKAHEKDQSKEFWNHLVVVTSKDANLTKAHARYLESRLIQIAKAAGRAVLANATTPPMKSLPEPDVMDMEYFLTQVQLVLPLLGLDALRPQGFVPAEASAGVPAAYSGLELLLTNKKHGVEALAVELDGEVTVLAGSLATKSEFVSNTYSERRAELIRDGSLVSVSDALMKFEKNISFESPSAAAAVVLNRNSNGRVEWRLKATGQTLKDWQDSKLRDASGP